MLKNKRADAQMVSFVLLIVIVITISLAVYSYLKLYLPSSKEKCPDDITIIIEDVKCLNGELKITLSNRGLFNVSMLFVRLGEEDRKVRPQVNKNQEVLSPPFAPGVTNIYSYNITNAPGEYIAEVQPAIFVEKRTPALCNNLPTQKVSCTVGPEPPPATCGDRIVNGNEECDDGNLDDRDGCNNNCMLPASSEKCGNGNRESPEQCDDGNRITESCPYGQTSCAVCDSSCNRISGATSYCGDNIIQTPNEECDDGNTKSYDGCSSSCKTEIITLVTGCRNLDNTNAIYVLNNSISGITSTCFTITRDNVTLNGQGKIISLQGNPSGTQRGIYSIGRANLKILNTNIKYFDEGIGLYSVSSSIIENNNILDSARYGIVLSNSATNKLLNNTIKNSTNTGLYLQDGSNTNDVYNNSITLSRAFGLIINSDSNYIYYNSICSIQGGIDILCSNDNNNQASGNIYTTNSGCTFFTGSSACPQSSPQQQQ